MYLFYLCVKIRALAFDRETGRFTARDNSFVFPQQFIGNILFGLGRWNSQQLHSFFKCSHVLSPQKKSNTILPDSQAGKFRPSISSHSSVYTTAASPVNLVHSP